MNENQIRLLTAYLRTDLSCFTRKVFKTVSPADKFLKNWHIDAISEHLMGVYEGDIKRLVINIPPRFLKSISVNVAFPAWVLGRDPSRRFLCASYAEKLSQKHSQDCRLVMESDWYQYIFPHVKFESDQNTKSKFVTTMRGQRLSTSVGSSAIGEGGDILIVDDAMSPDKALSQTGRENMLNWFQQGFVTRLTDKKRGAIIVIEQRLHEADLSGHLLSQGGWEHLNLPMIAEERQIIRYGNFEKVREEGELLHEERVGQKEVEQLRIDLGEYAFAAQQQQRPAPLGGGIFKDEWIESYRERPEGGRIIQSWDTAYKDKQINDPSVCTTWLELDNKFYLLHMSRDRLQYPQLKRKIIAMADEWKPDVVLIEDKASGQSLLQELRRDTQIPVVAIKPVGDKLTRAATSAIHFENGRVFIPKAASWLNTFKSELMSFPNAAHDDIVDSVSQFLNWMNKKSEPSIRRL